MSKVTTKEFVRTEIQSALSQIKPTNKKINFVDFMNLTFEKIIIEDDQIFSLLSNEKSRKEMLNLLQTTERGYKDKIYFIDVFENNSFFVESFKLSMRDILKLILKREFTRDTDYPSFASNLTFFLNKENIEKIINLLNLILKN